MIKITKIWTEGLEVDEGEQVREQDINQILIASRGYYVESGLLVHETTGTPNEYIQVDSGSAWVGSTKVTISATTQVGPFSVVSATGKERIDVVVIDDTGTLSIISGTEADAGQAKPPNVPEDQVVLAFVTINEDVTITVLDADIEDRRVFSPAHLTDTNNPHNVTSSQVLPSAAGKEYLIGVVTLFDAEELYDLGNLEAKYGRKVKINFSDFSSRGGTITRASLYYQVKAYGSSNPAPAPSLYDHTDGSKVYFDDGTWYAYGTSIYDYYETKIKDLRLTDFVTNHVYQFQVDGSLATDKGYYASVKILFWAKIE